MTQYVKKVVFNGNEYELVSIEDINKINSKFPKMGLGVGQFVKLESDSGAALNLPANGSWAYSIYCIENGEIIANIADVVAGGTMIALAVSNRVWRGFAWRIA